MFTLNCRLYNALPLLLRYRRTEDITVVKFTFGSFGLDSFEFDLPLCTVSLQESLANAR